MHHMFVAVVALVAFLPFCRQNDTEKLGGLDVFVVNMEYNWPGTTEWKAEATNCLNRIFDFGPKYANSRFGFGCSKALLLFRDHTYYIPLNRRDPIVDTTLTGCRDTNGENSVLNVLVKFKEIAHEDFLPDKSILTIFLADQYLKTDLVDNENALFFAKIPNEVLVIVKSDELSVDALFKLALGYIDDSWIMPFELGGCTDVFVEKFKKAVCISITGEPQSTEPCQPLTPGNCTRKITFKSPLHRGETICRNYLSVEHEPCDCLTTKLSTTTTEQDGVTDVKNSTNSKTIASKHSSSSALLFGLVVGGTIVVIFLIVVIIVVYVVCWRNRESQSAAASKGGSRAKRGPYSAKRPGLRSRGLKKLQKSTSKRRKSTSKSTTSLSKSKITTMQKSGLKSRMTGSKLAESHGEGSKKSKSRTSGSSKAKPHRTKSKSHFAGSKMSKSSTTKSRVAGSRTAKSHGANSVIADSK